MLHDDNFTLQYSMLTKHCQHSTVKYASSINWYDDSMPPTGNSMLQHDSSMLQYGSSMLQLHSNTLQYDDSMSATGNSMLQHRYSKVYDAKK